VGQSDQTIECC